eukprot:13900500-Alexandrium_andersonii.AAC.1
MGAFVGACACGGNSWHQRSSLADQMLWACRCFVVGFCWSAPGNQSSRKAEPFRQALRKG